MPSGISIAVDNALAYQEIHRLKERLVDENLALTEQLNNVDSEFGEIIGRMMPCTACSQVEMVAKSDSTVLDHSVKPVLKELDCPCDPQPQQPQQPDGEDELRGDACRIAGKRSVWS